MVDEEVTEKFDYREFLEAEFQKREADREVGVISDSSNGIPVLYSKGKSLARAWENSLIVLGARGSQARTEYDKKDPENNYIDRPSIDCSMTMVIEDPKSEPIIHRAFPGGLEDLEEYRQEVVDGIKNHWVRDTTDPTGTVWEYTYNERLNAYAVPLSKSLEIRAALPPVAKEVMAGNGIKVLLDQPWAKIENRLVNQYELVDGKAEIVGVEEQDFVVIDQIAAAIDQLSKSPYSRRVQAITWQPWEDPVSFDPACLQSFWWRLSPNKKVNTNMRFRSRDAFDAAFMNSFSFVHLIEKVARGISENRGEEITPGRFIDESDSYHIYGRRRDAYEQGFLKQVKWRSFEERTWNSEFAQMFFDEAKPKIIEKIKEKDSQ